MRFSKTSPTKWASLGAAAAAIMLLSAGQAQANAPGSGTFTGLEYPPAAIQDGPPSLLCATFDPNEPFEGETDPSGPLEQVLEMDGTFHGVEGTGTATFTSTQRYDANPEGTYAADSNCLVPSGVSGTMVINFGTYSCSGVGTYERRGTSVYSLSFDGSCTGGANTYDTEVEFAGTQAPCNPITGCVTAPTDPDAAAEMAGAYSQTDA